MCIKEYMLDCVLAVESSAFKWLTLHSTRSLALLQQASPSVWPTPCLDARSCSVAQMSAERRDTLAHTCGQETSKDKTGEATPRHQTHQRRRKSGTHLLFLTHLSIRLTFILEGRVPTKIPRSPRRHEFTLRPALEQNDI